MRSTLTITQQISVLLTIFIALTINSCGLTKQLEPTNSSPATSPEPATNSGPAVTDRIEKTNSTCQISTCPKDSVFNEATCSCEIQITGSFKFARKCGPPVLRGLCGDGSEATLADVPKQSEPYCDEIAAELNKSCALLNQGCVNRKELYCPDGNPLNGIGGLVCIADSGGKDSQRCPISSREFKSSIHYVNEKEAHQISRGILNLKIANYRYNDKTDLSGEPALGFIIEDYPSLPYAKSQSKTVDQYSYISAAVVTIQTQQAEIESLRKRLDQLEKNLQTREKKRALNTK